MAVQGDTLSTGGGVPDRQRVVIASERHYPLTVGARRTTPCRTPSRDHVVGEDADQRLRFVQAGGAMDPRTGSGAAAPLSLRGKTIGEALLPLQPVVQLLPEDLRAISQNVTLATQRTSDRPQRDRPLVGCRIWSA